MEKQVGEQVIVIRRIGTFAKGKNLWQGDPTCGYLKATAPTGWKEVKIERPECPEWELTHSVYEAY